MRPKLMERSERLPAGRQVSLMAEILLFDQNRPSPSRSGGRIQS